MCGASRRRKSHAPHLQAQAGSALLSSMLCAPLGAAPQASVSPTLHNTHRVPTQCWVFSPHRDNGLSAALLDRDLPGQGPGIPRAQHPQDLKGNKLTAWGTRSRAQQIIAGGVRNGYRKHKNV